MRCIAKLQLSDSMPVNEPENVFTTIFKGRTCPQSVFVFKYAPGLLVVCDFGRDAHCWEPFFVLTLVANDVKVCRDKDSYTIRGIL